MLDPLRWSHLRMMARSPAHYLHALHEGVTQTPAMRLGWLVHAFAFETGRFAVYDKTRRGKEWEEFQQQYADTEIVTRTEYDRARIIADTVLADPVGGPLLQGIREQRLLWKIGDRECAGTPDVRGDNFLTDLKTTADASPQRFPAFCLRSAYLGQLAWYLNAIRTLGLPVPGRICIVAVEVKPPYAVAVYELTERAIEVGTRTWRSLFEWLLSCESVGEFPGYSQCPIFLDAPEDLTLSIDGEEIEL